MALVPDPAFVAAAQAFVALEAGRAPDFSACLVLVPHQHAAQGFRQALRQVLPPETFPALRPPRLLTLPEWARGVPLAGGEDSPSRRLAELQQFLQRTGHIPPGALWQAAQELHDLLEQLDEWDCPLEGAPFEQLARAHQDNPYLGLEASIARMVWQAFKTALPGRARAHGLRLQALARQASHPIHTLGLYDLSPQEQACLAAWGKHQPIHDLPLPAPYPARQALLDAAWRDTSLALAPRAAQFAGQQAVSPLAGVLQIHAAAGLEQAARSAEQVLLEWLRAGHERIALVALDRLLARRLRALLERRGILVQDETGWAFSTSAVSHVLERWLGLVSGPVFPQALLDLLKSPYLFCQDAPGRQSTVHGLADALRRNLPPRDFPGYLALARDEGLARALPVLERLHQASQNFPRRRQTLSAWTQALRASLDQLDATPALAADPIGYQLLDLLARLQQDTRAYAQTFSLADWRRWLFLHLEQETFTDASVESPVRLTHLGAALYRPLEGALILGAGPHHLAGAARPGIFNDTALAQLGLPTSRHKARQAQAQWMTLLARVPRATFIWQSEADGDPAPLAPWLRQLEAFHQAAWGASLLGTDPMDGLEPPPAEAPGRAAPVATTPPSDLSVSAWQSLVSCPYQFFARHVLGLAPLDEWPEEMDKAEYGSLVHRILARFHTQHPRLADQDAPYWQAALEDISRAEFSRAEAQNIQALAWRLRWARHIPAYVAWALAREADGWGFEAGEVRLERTLAWGEGRQTRIYGRADRMESKQGMHAVLDYKTQPPQALKQKLDPAGEDVQLATYAWLAQAARSGFIALDDDPVRLLEPPLAPDQALQRAEAEAWRIGATLHAMADGQPLPAHGAPTTCARCEMQGLCRRAHHPE